MEQDRKFYLTPNRVVDLDTIADAEFFPAGSEIEFHRWYLLDEEARMKRVQEGGSEWGDPGTPNTRAAQEAEFKFKNGTSVMLNGEAADLAWRNFQGALAAANVSLVR